MPAPGPNYPSPSTVKRHSHQARLEAMFGLIETSMTKHNVLLGDVVNGLGTIANNTKQKDDDKEELERLRKQTQEKPKENPNTNPIRDTNPKIKVQNDMDMKHLIGGFLMGGLNSSLLGALPGVVGSVGKVLAGGLLAAAVAGPASDFISTLISRTVGDLTGNEALGANIGGIMQPNIQNGIIASVINKKFGFMTALVGSALDALTVAIGTDTLDIFGQEIDINSTGMKAGLSGIATVMMSKAGRGLIMSVGKRLLGLLSGPLGIAAMIGTVAWGVIDHYNQQWKDEIAGKAAKDLENGLADITKEREKTTWEGIFGGGPDTPIMDALAKLKSVGQNFEADNANTTWDGSLGSHVNVAPINESEITREEDVASFKTAKDTISAMVSDVQDISNLTRDQLGDVLALTRKFGVDGSEVERMLREMKDANTQRDMRYNEFAPILEKENFSASRDPVRSEDSNRAVFENYTRADRQQYLDAYDGFMDHILYNQQKGMDTAVSSVLRLGEQAALPGFMESINNNVYEKAAWDRLKTVDPAVYQVQPLINAPSSPTVVQGDTITNTTINNIGSDASTALRPHQGV